MSVKGQPMNLTIKSICALLIASNASASSYWESNISDNDLNWDTTNNQFAYQTWLEEVDGNPSSWQTSKLNYINNNYFVLNDITIHNGGTGTPDASITVADNDEGFFYNGEYTEYLTDDDDYTTYYWEDSWTDSFRNAHKQGWTGKGITLYRSHDTQWMDNWIPGAEVIKQNKYYGSYKGNSVYARLSGQRKDYILENGDEIIRIGQFPTNTKLEPITIEFYDGSQGAESDDWQTNCPAKINPTWNEAACYYSKTTKTTANLAIVWQKYNEMSAENVVSLYNLFPYDPLNNNLEKMLSPVGNLN